MEDERRDDDGGGKGRRFYVLGIDESSESEESEDHHHRSSWRERELARRCGLGYDLLAWASPHPSGGIFAVENTLLPLFNNPLSSSTRANHVYRISLLNVEPFFSSHPPCFLSPL